MGTRNNSEACEALAEELCHQRAARVPMEQVPHVEGEISWDPPSPNPTKVIHHQTDIGTSQGPQNCCSNIKPGAQTVVSASPLCDIQEICLRAPAHQWERGLHCLRQCDPTNHSTTHSALLFFIVTVQTAPLFIQITYSCSISRDNQLQWIEPSSPLPSALPQLLSHFMWYLDTALFV